MPGREPNFAQANFFAESPRGERSEFTIGISKPNPSAENEYGCQVTVGSQPTSEVYGVDQLQALALALAYAQHRMKLLMTSGWKFYMAESDAEPFDPCETYYPRLLRQ